MNRQLTLSLVLLLLMLFAAACGGAAPATAPDGAADDTAASESGAAVEEANESEAATESDTEGDAETDAADGLQVFSVVPGESKAMYLVDETFLSGALDKLGIAAGDYDIVGSTDQIEGELALDLANTAIGPSEFRVNVSTLSTDQSRRDRYVREDGPRFNQFPQAVFVATGVENAPAAYVEGEEVTFQLVGDMTIREVTQPMTFDVTATLEGDTISGTASTTALLTDFDIEPPNFANTLTVENEFGIQVDFVARAQ